MPQVVSIPREGCVQKVSSKSVSKLFNGATKRASNLDQNWYSMHRSSGALGKTLLIKKSGLSKNGLSRRNRDDGSDFHAIIVVPVDLVEKFGCYLDACQRSRLKFFLELRDAVDQDIELSQFRVQGLLSIEDSGRISHPVIMTWPIAECRRIW